VRPRTPTKLPDFRALCQHRFHLAHKAATVRDKRGKVDIPPSTVFSAIFLMGAMGWGSLLSCDRMLRTPVGKRWFRQQTPAVSDTTMARSLYQIQLVQLRQNLLDFYHLGVVDGRSKSQLRGGKQRIGIVDGSGLGRLLASCFEIVGPVSLMVGLEPMEKRGKELPAGYALLRQLKAKLGTGFVDLILGDGLYLNIPFFNLCLGEMKSDVLVKTDERGLRIIQDAVGLFRLACDIVTVCEVDTMRVRSYQITQAGGFFSRWHRHTTDGRQNRRGRHNVPAKC